MLMPTTNRAAIVSLAVAVALLLTAIGSYLWGRSGGYAQAEALGGKALAELRAEHKSALAESLAKALKRNEELVTAGNALAAQLLTTRGELAAARNDITRRIPHATAGLPADCAFGPAFVGLWNEALGLCAAGLPQAADPGGAAGGAPAAAAVDAGVQRGAPVAASPADLLAHLRDYGAYCQDLAATAKARRRLLEEWAQ